MLSAVLALMALEAAAVNPHLAKAREHLARLDERAALRALEEAKKWPHNTSDELAQVYFLRGQAHAALAQKPEAVESFKHALLLDPNLALPDDSSPRVRELWKEAGGAPSGAEPPPTEEPKPEPRPIAPEPVVVASPPPPAPPPPPRARWRLSPWVSGGLAAAGIAVIAAGAASGAQAGQLVDQSRSEARIRESAELHRQAAASATRANVLYGVGGAVLLGTGAVITFDLLTR